MFCEFINKYGNIYIYIYIEPTIEHVKELKETFEDFSFFDIENLKNDVVHLQQDLSLLCKGKQAFKPIFIRKDLFDQLHKNTSKKDTGFSGVSLVDTDPKHQKETKALLYKLERFSLDRLKPTGTMSKGKTAEKASLKKALNNAIFEDEEKVCKNVFLFL